MGDMKTPDFEDLLAAFDIPDIEAIQSSPEKERNEAVPHGEVKPKGADQCSPADHSDLPTVSVIVKNTVRADTLGCEKERHVQNDFKIHDSRKDDRQFTDMEFSNTGNDLKVTNGLKETDTKEKTQSTTYPLPQHLTKCTSTTFEHESKINALSLPPHYSQNAENSVKPVLHAQFSLSGGITEQHSVSLSCSQLPTSVSPPFFPQSSQGNTPSSNLSSSTVKARVNHVNHSDEESQSDLEGPLVIQESPESPESAMDLHDSSEKTSCPDPHKSSSPRSNKPQLKEEVQTITPSSLSDQLPIPSLLVKDEKYPEHVIDERDSPESPPPSETGMMIPKINSSPEPLHMDFDCKKQAMKSETSAKHKTGVTEELKTEVEGKFTSSITFEDNISTSAEIGPSSLSPVKDKMKIPPTGLTATTSVASETRRRAIPGVVKTLKKTLNTLSECPDTRSRRGVLKQSKTSVETATVKGTRLTMSASDSISKTPANVTPVGITLRSLGQKTLAGGIGLPIPSVSSLLPPLSSSKPASIVNSTGAIISKSQTNLVEAFNRILNNKNLLPSYKPDLTSSHLTEWGISLPAQGYRCLECGDSFALEQSLARHYDRRSLRMEVTCNHCAKRLAFFNKCSLLLHAREHKERGLIMQCSHLVMKPVPVEQMIGQQEPAATAPSSVLCQPNTYTAVLKKNEEVQYCNNKCPECQAQFSSPREVAIHFQELKSSQSTSCADCSPPMLLSNSCCAAAHQRIHQNCSPHVCPECGGTFKQSVLKTHLDETCFHYARRIGYRCSSCLVVFGGLNSVKSHIQQAHCDMFHKCPSCPMAFKSAPSIQNHIAAQHPTLKESQAMLIYKCVMCDTVFTHKSLLYVHFDTHLSNQKVHVFKCPECTKLFSLRSSLMDHLKTHNTKIKYESSPPIASPCTQPSVKMENSNGEEMMKRAKKVKSKKTLKQFLCNKCESSFATASSLRRHIRDKHKPVTRGFRCQSCTDVKKTFSSRAMLEKHIQLRHNLDSGDQNILMEGGDEADSSSEQDGTSFSFRRKRRAVKFEQKESSINGVSLVKKWRSSSAPQAGSLPEKGFQCAPCGFTCEDQGMFLEHIIHHRKGRGSNTQQCLQCGVCFTSNYSLSRHHFIVHKVRDLENQEGPSLCPAPSPEGHHDDKSSHGCSAPASPALSQGKDSEGTLACKVCGKQFEKTSDLNTHFRTHGMAFINARNTGKTT